MSKKDLIIASVAFNALLLIVLFIGSNQKKTESPTFLSKKQDVLVSSQQPTKKVDAPKKTSQDRINIADNDSKDEKNLKKNSRLALSEKYHDKISQTKSASSKKITIAKGDTLDKISKAYSATVSEIMSSNKLDSTKLKIGQELVVPVSEINQKENKPMKSDSSKKIDKEQNGVFYTVKSGDNPWTIAKKNNIQVEELLKMNNLTKDKAKNLRPGDKLKIK